MFPRRPQLPQPSARTTTRRVVRPRANSRRASAIPSPWAPWSWCRLPGAGRRGAARALRPLRPAAGRPWRTACLQFADAST